VCAERRIARQVRVVAARHGFSRGGPTPSSLRSQAARGATSAEYRRPRDRFRHRAGAYPRLSFTAATDEERERCRPASRVLLPHGRRSATDAHPRRSLRTRGQASRVTPIELPQLAHCDSAAVPDRPTRGTGTSRPQQRHAITLETAPFSRKRKRTVP